MKLKNKGLLIKDLNLKTFFISFYKNYFNPVYFYPF